MALVIILTTKKKKQTHFFNKDHISKIFSSFFHFVSLRENLGVGERKK